MEIPDVGYLLFDRDIIPGDVIAGAGDQAFHYECSPNETSRDRTWQRGRDLARRP
jgi:hypothetical protein